MSVYLSRRRRARAVAIAAAEPASAVERALAALTAVTMLLTGAYLVLM